MTVDTFFDLYKNVYNPSKVEVWSRDPCGRYIALMQILIFRNKGITTLINSVDKIVALLIF